MMRQGALWQDCGDGWQASETTLRLSGWTRERRVVLVRESPANAPVARIGKPRRGKDRQNFLPKTLGEGWDAQATPWSGKISVIVTSLDPNEFPTTVMPKHYRNQGDAENGFDELKNQWGWSGYTSRNLAPSRLIANLIALFYNWWNLYLRFYDEGHHREAIRTRPMLMAGVGRQVQSGGQRTVKVSILHEKGDLIAQAVTQITAKSYIRSAPSRSDGPWIRGGPCSSLDYSAAGSVENGSPACQLRPNYSSADEN
jgi:hypothetical protein